MRKKNRHKIIIGIEVMILSITVSLLGTNAASANPPSNGVSYNKNGQVTVENALDNLYSKANYGDAKASDILKGKKALVGGKEVVGTFTCPSLASLTPGDATPEDITDGKIAWVNGNKIVGTYGLLTDKVEIGDYISYTPSKTSYTIARSDTGASLERTINPSELNVWRVIRKNADGTVDLISEYVSSDIIELMGDTGYKNYIGILNRVAKQYESEGITVGSRHMGYDGTAEEYLTETGSNGHKDEGYKTDETLVRAAIGTLRAKSVRGGYGEQYWVASRYGRINIGVEYDYHIRLVGGEKTVYDDKIFDANILNCSGACLLPVRPIIVLKATLKITGGDGSQSSPYTLGT